MSLAAPEAPPDDAAADLGYRGTARRYQLSAAGGIRRQRVLLRFKSTWYGQRGIERK
jgi:hypothetical protein